MAKATGSPPHSETPSLVGQMKVVGSVNPNMPANATLLVRLTDPSGDTSLGNVNLDTSPRDLVIAAPPMSFTKVTILYTFRPIVPVTSRSVTFTLATYT